MRTRLRLLALLLVGALALAGCGEEASPRPAPLTKTPSATPSASALTSQPPVPEAVKGVDEAAARAFVNYYVELLGYATNTGDTRALKLLAFKSCKSCNSVAARVEQIYARGGKVEGSAQEVAEYLEVTADNIGFKVRVTLRSSDEKVAETRTSAPTTNPGGEVPCTFFLTKQRDGLYVDAWGCKK